MYPECQDRTELQSFAHLLSQLLYFHGELLAVFGVLPLSGLLALHHLQQAQHPLAPQRHDQIHQPGEDGDASAPTALSVATVC